MKVKRTIFAFGLVLSAITTEAADLDFSYNFSDAPSGGYGNAKTETYDVAVRLDNPSLSGARITGIRVAVPEEGITDTSAWLSSALSLTKKNGRNVNDPDIASFEGSASGGWLDITFESPYTVPAEGIYVGYSVTVTATDGPGDTPVSVVDGVHPDGLYLHTSRTKLRWGSMSEELGKVSAMTVLLEGSFPGESAIFDIGDMKAAACEGTEVLVPLINCGTTPITSVEYEGVIGDVVFTGSSVPERPVPGHICASGMTALKIAEVEEAGEYPMKLRITRINDVPIESPESEGRMTVYPFLPVNRPLIEEYTGLWCGWCPKGYVALETMKERKGDRFIAVAYHSGDDMAFSGNTPNSPNGYPAAYINRTASIDISDIYTGWDSYRTWIPDGDVKVNVEWADAARQSVRVEAAVRFIESHSGADYRLGYILVADGLSNNRWKQHNSYSGLTDREDDMPGHWGEVFLNGGEYVEGLTFNDVVVAATDFDGERGSIPAEIVAGEEYAHTHVFTFDGIPDAVLSVPEKLRVIAVLTDGRSGKFINCNSSPLMNGEPFVDLSSVEKVLIASTPVETGRWTLDGRRIDSPVKGLNIIRYSDGSTRKVMMTY